MISDSIKEVLSKVKSDKVTFVDLQFTDFLGNIKSSTIPVYNLEDALIRGVWIDGSSIEGFARIHESDMYLMPDPDTYALLPWRNNIQTGRVARLICDIYKPNHEPFEGDPRNILKRVLLEAKSMGYEYFTGPECEFFLFKKDEEGRIQRKSKGNGYYFNLIMDEAYAIKREIMEALFQMGIKSETCTHEVAEGQHEIDIRYDKALKTADNTISLKMATKFIAFQHNYHATFMPKPFFGINGSGMHIHQSLWKNGENIFYDKNDKYGLSKTAYQFLSGELKHIREIVGVLAPNVNSYKRLTPGYEAPVYTCWARINRSALIRVPKVSKGYEDKATRMEIRCPDPSGNPYLSFAVLLKAGMEGVKKSMKAPDPVEENLFEFNDEKLAEHYINKLPASLKEAIEEIKKGTIVKKTFGEYTWKRYIEAKEEEWDKFRIWVTDWEREKYLEMT
ncbi:glutamine synthetase [Candidatus Gottesmanbacteria bacterium CG11_big_fil_rev_8_21_14_0_20_37_11]|uniref:Glutamine synthetase n=3 Tax=Candidatus Gottesmaniibacteriota TaxID=1752720 RepID=A0A2M7RSC9_9BACT|nr:MAG: glutamine synthetase [Candidatus Gottesmanbacteria bacterium CG1_02_37_22]PIP32912.1 MAG: glutamine synthetase [Candidatus Gottesmanbacteria bacterium CG23_combo_of_CG06-09_8_20_14_all_37_19]PIR07952.1 MAG: glutamine synthetase [Candidatus Gottesmanbacteria bacterium CG11_big_fil_rev_8_21_14_0_20_37_11]PIZ03227.1 MAG: glutamine synthetase [Candidatus Gottesmanbacteria bacterium CG_4_10_14_0_8_um_filter_37_24]